MFVTPFALLAAADGSSAATNAGTFAILGAIVAAVRRKNAIGGWLFFFMWGVFLGCGFSLIQFAVDWRLYTPARWSDSTRYLMYVMSIAPLSAAFFGIAVTCFMLLRTMEWSWAELLRIALIVYICLICVSVAVDYFYFPRSLPARVASLLFPGLFLGYTYYSLRFQMVFQTHDWKGSIVTASLFGGRS